MLLSAYYKDFFRRRMAGYGGREKDLNSKRSERSQFYFNCNGWVVGNKDGGDNDKDDVKDVDYFLFGDEDRDVDYNDGILVL